MTFDWSPLPHVLLASGGPSETALNVLVYAMTLGLVGSCTWLFALAWLERDR